MKIPWAKPAIDASDRQEVRRTLRSNWLTMGPRTLEFESMMAAHATRRFAAAVCNGTAALDLGLRLLRLSPGDEVIVPALCYFATAAAVVSRGGVPVFADIEAEHPTISAAAIEGLVGPRTRLIVTMDYGGTPCDHTAIARLAKRKGLRILHDGAQSLGGEYRGSPLLAYGDVATTSFHAAKSVTTIEGGMVLTSTVADDRKVRLWRNQGESPQKKYEHVEIGANYRISDLHAAVGVSQMRRIERLIAKRRLLAHTYSSQLGQLSAVRLPSERALGRNGWFFYAVRIQDRNAAAAFLRDRGVETRIAYPKVLYDQPALRAWKRVRCPNAERFVREVLNLPMFDAMTKEQVRWVARVTGEFFGQREG
ncbi:MAG TPA: DegT/DnrJ/EryC1/StrS family aminotransferase [Polyangia bacterium]|jgi:perosamine synthetase|nr:DegT/DnrJ/EryC1/StrS family aminotransferase [Polyangia bacterium]